MHENANFATGIQRPLQFPNSGGKDYEFSLEKADQEIDVNIRGPMHLCVHLLPHLTSLPSNKTGIIMNVSSSLGFIPHEIINPVYCSTKTWLHYFTVIMRSQYKTQGGDARLKVIEIVPPQVETDLHRERKDPDDNKKSKSKVALSLDEFMNEVEDGWKNGDETITAGPGHEGVKLWFEGIGKKYENMVGA